MSEDIYDEYPSLTLAKETPDQNIEPLRLGQRIKDIRSKLGITLEEASQRTGLARSTLSKIENEQISPTFQAMQKLAMGLQIDMPQLFEPPRKKVATGRRDLTKAGQGKPHPTPTYEHELLATELSNKKMMPFKSRVRARAFEEYNDWVRHDGEEFLMVISGDIMFYSEFYEPIPMSEGDRFFVSVIFVLKLLNVTFWTVLILLRV
ncbi:helix-turn-helix domain-containing protein [Vibrio fortis]|uniref:helix-turn-helix domain-containing protein n=1 Tax=Vibrio fortis TaxID=212667 RepID=UPI003AFB6C0C